MIARFFAPIGELVARIFRSMLGINGDQQRALMTWAMIGAIVVLTALLWWMLGRLDAMLPPPSQDPEFKLALLIAAGIIDLARWVVCLMGLMMSGAVLIARGGEVTIKGPGGTEISARGSSANQLARNSELLKEGSGNGSSDAV